MEHEFQKHLRAALNHLYNPDQLRQNPLVALFHITDRFDAPSVLQRILIDAIETMRPKPGEPIHSEQRKIYEILSYRYIQQFKQDEVAHHLGVSDRHLRREQDHALEILALSLWNKLDSEDKSSPALRPETAPASPIEVQKEWEWLRKAHSDRITNLIPFTQKILELMKAVGQKNNTSFELVVTGPIPDLAVHPVAFRQILLNLLQVAIHNNQGGKIEIEMDAHLPFVGFRLQTVAPISPDLDAHHSQDVNLIEIAEHLCALSRGTLKAHLDEAGFSCELLLPAVDGMRVLVIDDNYEIIELLQRYSAGTRYNVIGCSDPEQAVEMAETSGAHILVMDVMMPKIDGWELLGRMRSHPRTRGLPVIILSILAQEELALSLGAKKLVLKPVTQDVFLTALDEVLASLNLESH